MNSSFQRFNVQSNLRYEQSYFLLLSIARRPYRMRTVLNASTSFPGTFPWLASQGKVPGNEVAECICHPF